MVIEHRPDESHDYPSDECRMIVENRKQLILKIKPDREQKARDWLGAANWYGDDEIIEHFVSELERVKDD
jgi:hypothetical protein